MQLIELRCIDPPRNMRRFYRLDVQPDLFGGVLLLRQWGRIGARGRIMAERYDHEAPALAALQKQAKAKRRKGYLPTSDSPPVSRKPPVMLQSLGGCVGCVDQSQRDFSPSKLQ